MPYDRERQYYRLLFPPGDLAEFTVGALRMHIHEVSERGIRYEPVAGHDPRIGDELEGVVVFKRVGQFPIRGKLSRRQGTTVVLVIDAPGIPYAALLQEQLHLRRRYPERFAK
jgi:hypothetical protein